MWKKILIMLVLAGATISHAQELMVNGDFEQDLNNGWLRDSLLGMTVGYDTMDRGLDFHPDPDYEARVKKYNSAYAKLYQVLDVSSLDLSFSCSAKLYAHEFNPAGSSWAAASIVLAYMNSADSLLGETRIINKSPHCPYTNSNNFHLIEVVDTTWIDYVININNELGNLPGINPTDISKIKVALFDTTDGC